MSNISFSRGELFNIRRILKNITTSLLDIFGLAEDVLKLPGVNACSICTKKTKVVNLEVLYVHLDKPFFENHTLPRIGVKNLERLAIKQMVCNSCNNSFISHKQKTVVA